MTVSVRRGAQVAMIGGLAVSLGANVLAADTPGVGWVAAGLPPIVLAVCVELIIKAPASSGVSWLRWAVTAGIGGIAAWISYWHMVEVGISVGEGSPHLLPLVVDGMVVVAMATLWDLGRQPAEEPVAATQSPAETPAPAHAPTPAPAPVRAEEPRPRPAPVPSKSKGGETPREAARAVLLEHPDWTISQVADAAGCSAGTVKNAKRDLEQLQAKAATNGHLAAVAS